MLMLFVNFVPSLLLSATIFSRHDALPIANLSRVDPALVSTGLHGKKHFHHVGNDSPFTFCSVIHVDDCNLDEGRTTSNDKLQKIIKGSLMEGEFERFVGAIGMIIGQRLYNAQLFRDVLTFSTFMTDFGVWCICFSLFSTSLTTMAGPSMSSSPIKGGKASTSGQPSPFSGRPSSSTSFQGTSNKVCLSARDNGASIFYLFIFNGLYF